MSVNLSAALTNIHNRFVRESLRSLQDAVNALPETPSGWNDTGGVIQTLDPSDAVRIDSFFDVFASAVPPLAPAGRGRIFFNGTKFRVSEDSGAFVDLVGGGGGGTGTVKEIY